MNGSKPWWQSKAMWGSLVALASMAIGVFSHTDLSPAQQSSTVDAISQIVTAAGTLYAMYGRLVAQHVLTATSKPAGTP